jgi:DNA invertase Pin-like site-specific DNA recombinase
MTYAARKRAQRDADIETLLRLGRMTHVQIARRMDVSVKTVERVKRDIGMIRGGVRATSRPPLTDEQRARAQAMLADGCSQAEVARTLGASRDQIRHAFKGQGWTAEQKTAAEHDTGIRKYTAPKLKGHPNG